MLRSFQQRAEQKLSGFQSPAADYLEGRLNIADVLVIDPHNTFYFRMDSSAMQSYGLQPDDILVVDRSVKPVDGAVVVAYVNGSFYCRCYCKKANIPVLKGDDGTVNTADGELIIWGVVTASCKNILPPALRRGRYKRVCTL